MLLDHFVEEKNLGGEACRKLNDGLPRPSFRRQRHSAIVFKVEIEGCLQSVSGRSQCLGLVFPLGDSFGNVFERDDESAVLVALQRNWIQEHRTHLFQAELFLDALDQTFLELGIVHRQNGLPSVQIDLEVRAFAGFEDRSLSREPTPELLARHIVYYKQYCLYQQLWTAASREENSYDRNSLRGLGWRTLVRGPFGKLRAGSSTPHLLSLRESRCSAQDDKFEVL